MTKIADKPAGRVIALEEAFLHPKLRELYPTSWVKILDLVGGRLSDVGPERIRRMDAAGIDLQVLSHVQPGVQSLDRDTAIRLSKEVNDWLGGVIKEHPTRFAGFAMLPTQSPKDAADELERAVAKFGFKELSLMVIRKGVIWTTHRSCRFSSGRRRWTCPSIFIRPIRHRRLRISITKAIRH
jgi:predicted TIM-barrel fold metal-dependent hydrolase